MPIVEFTIKLPVEVKRKAKVYVSRCPVLDLYSQGETESKARKNIIEAIRLFIVSCFEKGTLDSVLKECGFKPIKKIIHTPKDHKFVTVPIPFNIAAPNTACHV
jgi:predicted RNase H-like HicB family nuclease